MPFDPLTPPFRIFFCYVEPLLTFAGAVYAIFAPSVYAGELLPLSQYAASATSVAAIRQLGNWWGRLGNGLCRAFDSEDRSYLLIGSISFFVLPAISQTTKSDAEAVHDTLRVFFSVLSVLDWTHILVSLYDLRRTPLTRFNSLSHGNTTLVLGLFAWRAAWFITTARARRKAH